MNVFYDNDNDLHFERGFRNVLDANSIPTNVTVMTVGSPADNPPTYVSKPGRHPGPGGTSIVRRFCRRRGSDFRSRRKGVATTVTTNGSTLILTAAGNWHDQHGHRA